jgi:hypothetical protein
MHERKIAQAVSVLFVITLSACDKPSGPTSSTDSGPAIEVVDRAIPEDADHSWRELIVKRPDELHDLLGAPSCNRDSSLPRPTAENRALGRTLWSGACSYKPPGADDAPQRLERIRWSEGKPAIAWFVPNGDVPLAAAPELFETDTPANYRATHRGSDTFLTGRFETGIANAPVAEFLSKPNSADVRWLKVYFAGHEHWSYHDLLHGLPADTSFVGLNRKSDLVDADGVLVTLSEAGVEFFSVRDGDHERVGATEGFDAVRLDLARKTWAESAPEGALPPRLYYVPDDSVDGELLTAALTGASDLEYRRVKLVGSAESAAPEVPYLTVVDLPLRPEGRVFKRVDIRSNGVSLSSGGQAKPPIDGCPIGGLTLCKRDGSHDFERLAQALHEPDDSGDKAGSDLPVALHLANDESITSLFQAIEATAGKRVVWFHHPE